MRIHLDIEGIVQGVGFRPFLYSLAKKYNLVGIIQNTSRGVSIEVQGIATNVEQFCNLIVSKAPPLSEIYHIEKKEISENKSDLNLKIAGSSVNNGWTFISPEVAMCDDCATELRKPVNLRYQYSFINCTNCGPRFTIIEKLPYDRPFTTMKGFEMCDDCRAEYDDPSDRRFHAQPVACAKCGPNVWWGDVKGEKALDNAVEALNKDKIIAIKGLGGFHLACIAESTKAVKALRSVKSRPTKPFALMAPNVDFLENHFEFNSKEKKTLLSREAPIVLLKKIDALFDNVAPNNCRVGVMLPYTPLHEMLLEKIDKPLIMTSGNKNGNPIVMNDPIDLEKMCFGIIMHNRPIYRRCDDSVVINNTLVRRSRGYVPKPIVFSGLKGGILATGGDKKNVCAISHDNYAFLTPHIGNLDNPKTNKYMQESVLDFEDMFKSNTNLIVCDMHPNYKSSHYAKIRSSNEKLSLLEVQHHHAHIASCMVDNNYTKKVIGIAFDGAGYGVDNKTWGSEFMYVDLSGFERLFHLQYLPLVGGDSATKNPRRIAYAYIKTLFPENTYVDRLLSVQEKNTIDTMLVKNINVHGTSSMGRLFDAVSALLGLCSEATYEAEAAIALEACAANYDVCELLEYSYQIKDKQILLKDLFSEILNDLESGVPVEEIAYRFHLTVANMCLDIIKRINKPSLLVALSGGVWQNQLLLELALKLLNDNGNRVLTHHQVPSNDGGISLGQLAIASYGLTC